MAITDNAASDAITTQNRALAELQSMRTVFDALAGLEPDSIERVLNWAGDQFGIDASTLRCKGTPENKHSRSAESPETNEESEFTSIADLFAAAMPSTGPARALVAGYWFQIIKKQDEFDGRSINDALKQLGHPLANVTTTILALISQRPQLMIQTQKIGKGAQGRKRYKLTQPGIDKVRRMLEGDQSETED